MDKRVLLFGVISILIIGTTAAYFIFFIKRPKEKEERDIIREETIGGKYQARVEIDGEWQLCEVGEIIYVKDNVKYTGYYDACFKDALNWIKENTEEDTIFLNWWDYGHMIIGYAERETVCKSPSEEVLESIADPSNIKEFESHEKIVDIAKALTTINENETVLNMEKYGASYIFVTVDDGMTKAPWIFKFAGVEYEDYIHSEEFPWSRKLYADVYMEIGKQTMVYKMLTGSEFEHLIQVYKDEMVYIYTYSSE